MSIGIFLPVRKGSQRVKDKNTKVFGGYEGGLLELKICQLIKVPDIAEIVISTNDENAFEIVEKSFSKIKNLRIVKRPAKLACADTDLGDLIKYASGIMATEVILWTHVTSPFCDEKVYSEAIKLFNSLTTKEFDSLVSVQKFQNFLWDREKNDIINRKGKKIWPATQDLKELLEINNAIFLAPKKFYDKKRNRIGNSPFFFEMEKIPSLDIDVEEDFKIAEAVYDKYFK